MSELKPCPFCGGGANIIKEYDCMMGINIYFIECTNCKASLYGGTNKEEEIEKWNRRATNETD